jgi:hypothetical protein
MTIARTRELFLACPTSQTSFSIHRSIDFFHRSIDFLRSETFSNVIDTLKQYCTEKNAGDSVHVLVRVLENDLMLLTMNGSTIQRSMNSYFAKKND